MRRKKFPTDIDYSRVQILEVFVHTPFNTKTLFDWLNKLSGHKMVVRLGAAYRDGQVLSL